MLDFYNSLPLVDVAGLFYKVTTVKEYMDKFRANYDTPLMGRFSFFLGENLLRIESLGSHGDGYGGLIYTYSVKDILPTDEVKPDTRLYILNGAAPVSAPKTLPLATPIKTKKQHMVSYIQKCLETEPNLTFGKPTVRELLGLFIEETRRADRDADRCIILKAQNDGLVHELTELRAKEAESEAYYNLALSYFALDAVKEAQNGNGWVTPEMDDTKPRYATKEEAMENYIAHVRQRVQNALKEERN